MKNKHLLVIVALVLVLTLGSIGSAAITTAYTDVSDTHWAKTYIQSLSREGGINGYPDGSFRPGNPITVAEFVKITVGIYRGKQEPTDTHWASGYMDKAAELEIVPEGMFTKADYNTPITREKMAVIMERTAELILKEDTYKDATTANFADAASICEYCDEYIAQAVSRGLLNGYTSADGISTFKPQNSATRAEASAMLVRLAEKAMRIQPGTSDVVKSGDNLADVAADPDLFSGSKHYAILTDGSKYNLSYLYSAEDAYGEYIIMSYKFFDQVILLDKDGEFLDCTAPFALKPEQAYYSFSCRITDVAYFVFDDSETDTIYLVPNTYI